MTGCLLTSETAVSLAALIRSRAVSCLEGTQAVLTRIEALEPTPNAVLVLDVGWPGRSSHIRSTSRMPRPYRCRAR